MNEYIVKEIKNNEFENIAKIHLDTFKNFFLSSLGENFLIHFYSSINKIENSICLGLYFNNKLVGFAIGVNHMKSFYPNLFRKNFFQFFRILIKKIIKNPKIFFLFYFKIFSRYISLRTIPDKGYYDLLSICVCHEHQKLGQGNFLLSSFEKKVSEKSSNISLTTDKFDNESVINFYKKNGYDIVGNIVQNKRVLLKMFKKF